MYTAIFTLPFVYFLFFFFHSHNTFRFFPRVFIHPGYSPLIALIIFLAFAVKLPIYGIHFWLPMAHVEAPTFGSIVLAGVLLKLGGLGLMRLSSYLVWSDLFGFLVGYFMVGLSFVTLLCCFQSDFKRMVAFRRISHMIALPPIILFGSSSGSLSSIFVMIFHGLSSPLLFLLVGISYSAYSTRQFVLMRGLMLINPLLRFFIVLVFLFSLSAPPFPSFIREAFFFISVTSSTFLFIPFLIVFAFFSMVYNLMWLTPMVFTTSSPSSPSFAFRFSHFIVCVSGLLVCLVFIFLLGVINCVSFLHSFSLVYRF